MYVKEAAPALNRTALMTDMAILRVRVLWSLLLQHKSLYELPNVSYWEFPHPTPSRPATVAVASC